MEAAISLLYVDGVGIVAFMAARDRLIAVGESSMTSSQVCAAIAQSVNDVARHDAAAVMTTDPQTHLPAGGVVQGFDPSACVPFWDNELLDPDFNKFNDLVRRVDPVATLSEATDGDLARSPRFQKLYGPFGASDELRVVFCSGAQCLAIAAFVRCDGRHFSSTEVRDVSNLRVPASNALRRALGRVPPPLMGDGPVVVLLDREGRVTGRSRGADAVLEDLRIHSVDDGTELPGTILVAAAKARASRSASRLTTRLRGRSGGYVSMHVAPLEGDSGAVSLTIEAARPGDLVPVLLRSYGLTIRETDLVLALCRGLGTKEMAAELAISVHTVRDHLKAVFDKTGVRSRGELVAKLFANHVLGAFHETVDQL